MVLILVMFSASRMGFGKEPLVGDEPHYLLIADSLVNDGDVDLKNNYQQETYRNFYSNDISNTRFPTTVNPQNNYQESLNRPAERHINLVRFPSLSLHWFSYHTIGLPLLVAGPYKALGLDGVVILMLCIAIGVALLTYRWALTVTRHALPALISTGIIVLSLSFIGLSGKVFPDLPIAGLLLGTVMLLERKRQTWWQQVLIGLSLAAGYSLHPKTILMFGTIAAFASLNILHSKDSAQKRAGLLLCLFLPAIIGIGVIEWHLLATQGIWNPSDLYSKQTLWENSPVLGVFSSWLDPTKGVLINNPAWLLALIGLPMWYRAAPKQFVRIVLIILPSLLLFATFRDWSGGFAPPGRYLLEVMPLLAPAAGLYVWKSETGFFWLSVLGGLQLFMLIMSLVNQLGTVELGVANPVVSALIDGSGIEPAEIVWLAILVIAILVLALSWLFLSKGKERPLSDVWGDDQGWK